MVLISDIHPCRRTKLFEVCSENGPEFIANEKFLTDNEIRRGEAFEDEDFEFLRAKAQLLDGIRKALAMLERKDYSEKELFRKLCEKGIPEDAAAAALNYVKERGYQSDERYARRLAELAKQSYGRNRAEQILFQHGIQKDLAREALDEIFSDEASESEKLDTILARAVKGKDLNDPNTRHKIFAKLARLGYSPSEIGKAFSRYGEDRKDDFF